jgi:hypothetical protein
MVVTADHLGGEEPLSPELVLVLPPELRARALAQLTEPAWPTGRPHPAAAAPRPPESATTILKNILVPRLAQLAAIFVAISILTLILSAVANAVRV